MSRWSVGLWIMAALTAALWALVYLWALGMACAFVTSGTLGQCRIKLPWELRGDDLLWLVLIPGAVVGTLSVSAWRAGRR